jgi:hypothetical protein
MANYQESQEAADIARLLIQEVHEHLADYDITFLLSDAKPKEVGGCTSIAKASMMNDLERYFHGQGYAHEAATFKVVIVGQVWAALKPKQKKALIDHELSHFRVKADEKTGENLPMVAGHDMEEFAEVLARNGRWNDDIVLFFDRAGVQLGFGDMDATDRAPTRGHGVDKVIDGVEKEAKKRGKRTSRSKDGGLVIHDHAVENAQEDAAEESDDGVGDYDPADTEAVTA